MRTCKKCLEEKEWGASLYPIRGKEVSGLHVLGNLQVLTIRENRSKGAKHLGDVL